MGSSDLNGRSDVGHAGADDKFDDLARIKRKAFHPPQRPSWHGGFCALYIRCRASTSRFPASTAAHT